jgi:hypothetical protein
MERVVKGDEDQECDVAQQKEGAGAKEESGRKEVKRMILKERQGETRGLEEGCGGRRQMIYISS